MTSFWNNSLKFNAVRTLKNVASLYLKHLLQETLKSLYKRGSLWDLLDIGTTLKTVLNCSHNLKGLSYLKLSRTALQLFANWTNFVVVTSSATRTGFFERSFFCKSCPIIWQLFELLYNFHFWSKNFLWILFRHFWTRLGYFSLLHLVALFKNYDIGRRVLKLKIMWPKWKMMMLLHHCEHKRFRSCGKGSKLFHVAGLLIK